VPPEKCLLPLHAGTLAEKDKDELSRDTVYEFSTTVYLCELKCVSRGMRFAQEWKMDKEET